MKISGEAGLHLYLLPSIRSCHSVMLKKFLLSRQRNDGQLFRQNQLQHHDPVNQVYHRIILLPHFNLDELPFVEQQVEQRKSLTLRKWLIIDCGK